jgi:hypothetical protein
MMNAPVSSTTLLPREELIKLLCTADGKGRDAKMEQLTLLFGSIDKLGDSLALLNKTWGEVKRAHEENTAIVRDLAIDRDNWKTMAQEYQRLLDNRGLR